MFDEPVTASFSSIRVSDNMFDSPPQIPVASVTNTTSFQSLQPISTVQNMTEKVQQGSAASFQSVHVSEHMFDAPPAQNSYSSVHVSEHMFE